MDWEGFNACGEENSGKLPALDNNNAGTGGSMRVATSHPHRQQLCGLDAAHSESTSMAVTMAIGREHKNGDGSGDCKDVTMEGGSHRSPGGSCPSRPAEGVVVMLHV